ncbi:MAG TPA: hypothetical protein V6D30_00410 [Leptolyngbyaceae cyanobacterium]
MRRGREKRSCFPGQQASAIAKRCCLQQIALALTRGVSAQSNAAYSRSRFLLGELGMSRESGRLRISQNILFVQLLVGTITDSECWFII